MTIRQKAIHATLAFLFLLSFVRGESLESNPLFMVSQGGKLGFINEHGVTVIPLVFFDGAYDFHEGRTCVNSTSVRQPKYSVIDGEGHEIAPALFSACGRFSEGLAAVAIDTEKTRKNCSDCDPFYHWGYIDRTGAMTIKPQFHKASEFSEQMAAVSNQEGKWGYIDSTGSLVIDFQFDFASSFSEGLAAVVVDKKYLFIDQSGKKAINASFVEARAFSDGLALVRTSGKFIPIFGAYVGTKADRKQKFQYIDKSGQTVIKLEGSRASRFSEGLAAFEVVKKDGYEYCGYIDKSGVKIVSPRLDICDDFSEGLASVFFDGEWHYIDKTGTVRIDSPFVTARSFHNGLALFLDGPTPSTAADVGYIDKSGRVVWHSSH